MKLINYKNEIRAIARANDVDIGVARDMFLANVRNAGNKGLPYYAGADAVDYVALKAEIPAIGTQAYADMCNEFTEDFKKGM